MKIKRVDENSISCRISKEELEEMGLALDDLISNKEKARDLLREVLAEAKDRVDFHADSGQLNVQMSVLPEGDVTLTIFDDQKSAIAAMLHQYKELLQQHTPEELKDGGTIREFLEGADLDDDDDDEDEDDDIVFSDVSPQVERVSSILTRLKTKETRDLLESLEDDEPVMLPVTVSFDRLDDVVRLSKQILPWNPMAKSDLYKADGRYYLSIVLTDHKISMARTIFALAEYSGSPKFRAHTSPYLQEHGRRLCSGDALAILARL